MKFEYIGSGSKDCPLIRIYGEESFGALIDSFVGLSNGQIESVSVEALPSYESIFGCRLTMSVGISDEGVRNISGSSSCFTWIMTRQSWDDLAAFAEPFHEFLGYQYQWLAGREAELPNFAKSEIALLISTYPDGQW